MSHRRDTLCLARRHRDRLISAPALAWARQLARETGLEAEFVHGALENAPKLTPRPFALVFPTWATVCWLPDIRQ